MQTITVDTHGTCWAARDYRGQLVGAAKTKDALIKLLKDAGYTYINATNCNNSNI